MPNGITLEGETVEGGWVGVGVEDEDEDEDEDEGEKNSSRR